MTQFGVPRKESELVSSVPEGCGLSLVLAFEGGPSGRRPQSVEDTVLSL